MPAAAEDGNGVPGRDKGRSRLLSDLSADRLLQNWKEAYERTQAYLEALGIAETERSELAWRAVECAVGDASWGTDSSAVERTLRAALTLLPRSFAGAGEAGEGQAGDFQAGRLRRWLFGGRSTSRGDAPALLSALVDSGRFRSMPKLSRRSFTATRFRRGGARGLTTRPGSRSLASREPDTLTSAGGDAAAVRTGRDQRPWVRIASGRRALLAGLALIPTIIASGFMVEVLPHQGRTPLELVIVLIFGVLFGWISIGFWTAAAGFFTLIRRADRFAITYGNSKDETEPDSGARTAILMTICDEPVDRVFAGLQAIYRSLERTGALEYFDFFVLSDTRDPQLWVKEEQAWFELCRCSEGFGRIFYRRRRVRLKRKTGNIGDFCRRWGQQYRYMIVLDADSVMTGESLVCLRRLMDRNPNVGIIQTVPLAVNRRSLFARVEQFAKRVYGPIFTAGLHFWQLGHGQYWGHNAIIRVAPFMEHCGLPKLPGEPPFGGEILSHDFVEAALLGRAGWAIWLAFDLPGSYEETPASLLEEMNRDRRWCQGNLQHLRLLFTRGLSGAHRTLFVNGVLSYVSALLWFGFLSVSTANAVLEALREPDYFPSGPSLFPEWPIWRPDWALELLAVTAMILLLPKIMSVLLILLKSRNGCSFGGYIKLLLSVALEMLISSLFAPIRMAFHSKFVLLNLMGRSVSWRSQTRGDRATAWPEAFRHHAVDTVVGSAWGMSVYWLDPEFFWWLTPIVGALILSIPLSVYSSRRRLGDWVQSLGLFVIPEESFPPQELTDLRCALQATRQAAHALPTAEANGFVRAVVDPYLNALHCALLGGRRSLKSVVWASRRRLLDRALAEGPSALVAGEQRVLLSDPEMMSEIHIGVWSLEDRERAKRWGRPGLRPVQ